MKIFNVLVGTIPVYDGCVLLTQRSATERFMPEAWGLPCGKINFSERLEEAVARELLEETGLHGNDIHIVGYSMFMSHKDDNDLHNLQINYVVHISQPEPVILDKSSQAYKWIPLEQYHHEGLDEFTCSTLKQALKYSRKE